MNDSRRCAEAYQRLKNLKLVGAELGIGWQTVYVHLRAAGIPVTGDKARYGSEKDRLAARAEAEFQRLVPFAKNQNHAEFQAKLDFSVNELGVDVKSSSRSGGKYPRWAFCIKKQEFSADFLACFAYQQPGAYRLLLLPGEIVRRYQTISLAETASSKWWDYEMNPSDLAEFFNNLSQRAA